MDSVILYNQQRLNFHWYWTGFHINIRFFRFELEPIEIFIPLVVL